jgi:hypothetical protein
VGFFIDKLTEIQGNDEKKFGAVPCFKGECDIKSGQRF